MREDGAALVPVDDTRERRALYLRSLVILAGSVAIGVVVAAAVHAV